MIDQWAQEFRLRRPRFDKRSEFGEFLRLTPKTRQQKQNDDARYDRRYDDRRYDDRGYYREYEPRRYERYYDD